MTLGLRFVILVSIFTRIFFVGVHEPWGANDLYAQVPISSELRNDPTPLEDRIFEPRHDLIVVPTPTVFTGKVIGITDGDTVKVLRDNQTVKIRLSGIDAPEMDQPFGKQSKRFVSKLIFGKTVDVKDLGLDRYKRTLGYITEGSKCGCQSHDL